jgi:uncharacterized damage-inducible protein DinB
MLAELYKHNLWANLLSLEACARLNDEQLDTTALGTYGSIRETFLHLARAEERYVARLANQPRPPSKERTPFPGFDELRAALTKSGEALIEIANTAQPTDIARGINPNGEPYEIASSVLLTQAINHATEHRAHINVILTHLGVQSPELDAWAYGDAHGLIK